MDHISYAYPQKFWNLCIILPFVWLLTLHHNRILTFYLFSVRIYKIIFCLVQLNPNNMQYFCFLPLLLNKYSYRKNKELRCG
uniref:Uncharacterized protein n=1 Tax=Panstrongylus lignarius TaxID=156445 RepID=A0A224Y4Q9_9HEMI